MLAVANTASNSPHPPTAKDRNPVSWIDCTVMQIMLKRRERERERESERES
jgi:hypothetical protein